MTSHEYHLPSDDDIEQEIEREELVEHYLDERDMSYEELIDQLKKLGGEIAFHDSEQLARLCASFSTGVKVEFSELQIPGDYQPGTITEDSFLVPHANMGRQPKTYRPYICVTIQDTQGTIDVVLYPVAQRSTGRLEVGGLRIASTPDQA